MFKFVIYKIGQFIVNYLPLDFSYGFASFVSTLQYHFSPRDRRAVRNNLKEILPDPADDLAGKAKQVFQNFGKYLVEFFRMTQSIDRDFVHRHITVKNLPYLDDCLKRGKGVIVVTAHIGNWELGAMVLGLLGYPVVAIALPHKERPVNELFNKQREMKGVSVVPVQHAFRRCLEALKENKVVALVADRDFTSSGFLMDFLGKKAQIPKGPAIFSVRTGAPIVPSFLIRNDDNTFSMTLEQPIYPPMQEEGQIEDDVLQSVIRPYLAVIEQRIRQYPTQWLMFRKYWVS
ncbi:MAG: lysophospholipid acyltransferase family protein [Candidatus Omnitrophota bacterium]|nr:lysophospholipid acyltransferase family protein [Candidatus Omnitrophota bacterium]MDZ4241302.1 lysophospholipid acyltransferase family protein [Candidatus Omnitrophota bacterium]